MSRGWLVFGCVCVSLLVSLAAIEREALADGRGAIEGRVRYHGKRRPSAPVTVPPQFVAACGSVKVPEDLIVAHDGALANVVLSIDVPGAAAPPPTSLLIDQKQCVYTPHVVAGPVQSTLVMANSDTTLHTVHALRGERSLANQAMPIQGQRLPLPQTVLSRAGTVTLQCEAGHSWMSAFIHVFNHPYFAVTDSAGAFRIEGLPPGTFQLRIEHEVLGTFTRQITVPAGGGAVHIDIDLD